MSTQVEREFHVMKYCVSDEYLVIRKAWIITQVGDAVTAGLPEHITREAVKNFKERDRDWKTTKLFKEKGFDDCDSAFEYLEQIKQHQNQSTASEEISKTQNKNQEIANSNKITLTFLSSRSQAKSVASPIPSTSMDPIKKPNPNLIILGNKTIKPAESTPLHPENQQKKKSDFDLVPFTQRIISPVNNLPSSVGRKETISRILAENVPLCPPGLEDEYFNVENTQLLAKNNKVVGLPRDIRFESIRKGNIKSSSQNMPLCPPGLEDEFLSTQNTLNALTERESATIKSDRPSINALSPSQHKPTTGKYKIPITNAASNVPRVENECINRKSESPVKDAPSIASTVEEVSVGRNALSHAPKREHHSAKSESPILKALSKARNLKCKSAQHTLKVEQKSENPVKDVSSKAPKVENESSSGKSDSTIVRAPSTASKQEHKMAKRISESRNSASTIINAPSHTPIVEQKSESPARNASSKAPRVEHESSIGKSDSTIVKVPLTAPRQEHDMAKRMSASRNSESTVINALSHTPIVEQQSESPAINASSKAPRVEHESSSRKSDSTIIKKTASTAPIQKREIANRNSTSPVKDAPLRFSRIEHRSTNKKSDSSVINPPPKAPTEENKPARRHSESSVKNASAHALRVEHESKKRNTESLVKDASLNDPKIEHHSVKRRSEWPVIHAQSTAPKSEHELKKRKSESSGINSSAHALREEHDKYATRKLESPFKNALVHNSRVEDNSKKRKSESPGINAPSAAHREEHESANRKSEDSVTNAPPLVLTAEHESKKRKSDSPDINALSHAPTFEQESKRKKSVSPVINASIHAPRIEEESNKRKSENTITNAPSHAPRVEHKSVSRKSDSPVINALSDAPTAEHESKRRKSVSPIINAPSHASIIEHESKRRKSENPDINAPSVAHKVEHESANSKSESFVINATEPLLASAKENNPISVSLDKKVLEKESTYSGDLRAEENENEMSKLVRPTKNESELKSLSPIPKMIIKLDGNGNARKCLPQNSNANDNATRTPKNRVQQVSSFTSVVDYANPQPSTSKDYPANSNKLQSNASAVNMSNDEEEGETEIENAITMEKKSQSSQNIMGDNTHVYREPEIQRKVHRVNISDLIKLHHKLEENNFNIRNMKISLDYSLKSITSILGTIRDTKKIIDECFKSKSSLRRNIVNMAANRSGNVDMRNERNRRHFFAKHGYPYLNLLNVENKPTLKYQRPRLGETTKLVRNSDIYVDKQALKHIELHARDWRHMARSLMREIFTEGALKKCSVTGRRSNTYSRKRPGLHGEGLRAMCDYLAEFRKTRRGVGWEPINKYSLRRMLSDFLCYCRKKL